jgi:hypothetical protein
MHAAASELSPREMTREGREASEGKQNLQPRLCRKEIFRAFAHIAAFARNHSHSNSRVTAPQFYGTSPRHENFFTDLHDGHQPLPGGEL